MVKENKISDKEETVATTTSQKVQTVTFEIKGHLYGINILSLDEIIPMLEFKPIPKGPQFLEGIVNLRGEIIPIVDFRKVFGHSGKNYKLDTRILVAAFHSRRVGFIVDGVREIMDLDKEVVSDSVVSREHSQFIEGIAKLDMGQIVQIIAIDKVLDGDALKKLSKVKLEESH